MQVELRTIKQQVLQAVTQLLEQANLKKGDVFVLGCSSSEICGGHIGKASSAEVGEAVIDTILPILNERGIYLAVQGCEHINRALVIEREAAEKNNLEIVTVKPALHAILPILNERGIYLAVQGCEHINRALVIEREAAEKNNLEIVTVKPALHAGGACSVAAYERAKDPVMVEHIVAKAGMDIGDTFIGQHIKHVAIPVRLPIKEIGQAHATFVRSRPKLIGGPRAEYPDDRR